MHPPLPRYTSSQAVLATLSHLIWIADAGGAISWVNERTPAYFGRTFQECLGHAYMTLLHPDDVARATAAWAHCGTTGDPLDIDYRFRTAQGEYRWQCVRAEAVKGEDGQVKYWVGTCTDIHEQLGRVERLRTQLARRNSESGGAESTV